jgi:hypothetical protein
MSAVFPCSWGDRTREEIVASSCPDCESPLVLHQPDPELPHRLLGVCEACKAWYISDAEGLLLTRITVPKGDRSRRGRPGR